MRKKQETEPLRIGDERPTEEMTDRSLFWPLSDSGGITIIDPPINEQLDKLLDCIDSMESVRDGFKEIDRARIPDELVTLDVRSPSSDMNSERGLALRHHAEKRYQLLGQALAALIEIVTCEVRFCAVNAGLLLKLPPKRAN